MISKLRILGFQSHKNTELTLHPGVNCIVGSSDVGKSSIIRALRWLVWNRPTGDAFRSYWGGDTSVEIELDKIVLVGRIKSAKENAYWLENTKFSAFKTDIPDEISKVLNISEVNVSRQFDRPYLLDSTPGEVAAHWNRIAHLDVIDSATKNVQRWAREIESDIKANENTIALLTKDLEQYVGLDDLESKVVALEQLAEASKQILLDVANLSTLINQIEAVDETITDTSKLLKHEATVIALIANYDEIVAINSKVKNLLTMLNDINNVSELIDEWKSKTDEFERAFNDNFPDICPLCGTKIE